LSPDYATESRVSQRLGYYFSSGCDRATYLKIPADSNEKTLTGVGKIWYDVIWYDRFKIASTAFYQVYPERGCYWSQRFIFAFGEAFFIV
jgi:hypothetical protein